MEYEAGTVGRVIYARLDDGDDLHETLTEIIRKEEIQTAWFQIFGGLKGADVVIGPREPVMPPDPVWQTVTNAREILGTGSVFWDGETPVIHLHAAMGHHGETITGCVRKNSTVYLITELIIQEIRGIDITRPWFEKGGFNRPAFNLREEENEKAG